VPVGISLEVRWWGAEERSGERAAEKKLYKGSVVPSKKKYITVQ